MKLQNKKGFTLIELLVVITIIGILATGATTVYTSQIQKARDSVRLTDVKALQWWIEQFYQDKTEYPGTDSTNANWEYFTWVTAYTPKFPKDPKSGQPCNKWTLSTGTACDYIYAVSEDTNGILRWEYKLSTAFEQIWNIESKASVDNWLSTELNRYELGTNLWDTNKSTLCDRSAKVTVPAWVSTITTSICVAAISNSSWNWSLIISGN